MVNGFGEHIPPPPQPQGGQLRYTNRGPWLVLAQTGPVMYKIQCHPQAQPNALLPRFWRGAT